MLLGWCGWLEFRTREFTGNQQPIGTVAALLHHDEIQLHNARLCHVTESY
jgi:hypothetical protein